jgi:hypothetical protein
VEEDVASRWLMLGILQVNLKLFVVGHLAKTGKGVSGLVVEVCRL